MLRGNLQQGQRRAQVVVQVATGGMNRATGTQDAGKHLFDRGLAAGAGDRYHRFVVAGTVQRTELPEGQTAVGNHQLRQIDIGHFTLHQRCHSALGLHIGQVVVAVETRPRQGDEQLPGADAAAVDADTAEAGICADQASAQCCGQLAECHGLKHVEPPRLQVPFRLRPGRRSRGADH
ncbi:hypothetical protein D3C81_1008030 [compost metagenome]